MGGSGHGRSFGESFVPQWVIRHIPFGVNFFMCRIRTRASTEWRLQLLFVFRLLSLCLFVGRFKNRAWLRAWHREPRVGNIVFYVFFPPDAALPSSAEMGNMCISRRIFRCRAICHPSTSYSGAEHPCDPIPQQVVRST